MQDIDTKFAQYNYPNGPLLTRVDATRHESYIQRRNNGEYMIPRPAPDQPWDSVLIPRDAAKNEIKSKLGLDYELEWSNPDHAALIKEHLPSLIPDFERALTVHERMPPPNFALWMRHRSYFHVVKKVDARSMWHGTLAHGQPMHYYHGSDGNANFAGGIEKDMGELSLLCSCIDASRTGICDHAGGLGLAWQPAPLLQRFDDSRVGFRRIGVRNERIPRALTRMTELAAVPAAAAPELQPLAFASAADATSIEGRGDGAIAEADSASTEASVRTGTEVPKIVIGVISVRASTLINPVRVSSPLASQFHGDAAGKRPHPPVSPERTREQEARAREPPTSAKTVLQSAEQIADEPLTGIELHNAIVAIKDEQTGVWMRGTVVGTPRAVSRRHLGDPVERTYVVQLQQRTGPGKHGIERQVKLLVEDYHTTWARLVLKPRSTSPPTP
jgi:hypothetical protein